MNEARDLRGPIFTPRRETSAYNIVRGFIRAVFRTKVNPSRIEPFAHYAAQQEEDKTSGQMPCSSGSASISDRLPFAESSAARGRLMGGD